MVSPRNDYRFCHLYECHLSKCYLYAASALLRAAVMLQIALLDIPSSHMDLLRQTAPPKPVPVMPGVRLLLCTNFILDTAVSCVIAQASYQNATSRHHVHITVTS